MTNEEGIQRANTENKNRAKCPDVIIRDQVPLEPDKMDKFSKTLNKAPHKVIDKDGDNVVVKSPSGAI